MKERADERKNEEINEAPGVMEKSLRKAISSDSTGCEE